jgi:hypothetical protein
MVATPLQQAAKVFNYFLNFHHLTLDWRRTFRKAKCNTGKDELACEAMDVFQATKLRTLQVNAQVILMACYSALISDCQTTP